MLAEHPPLDRPDGGIVGQLWFDGSVQCVDHCEQTNDGIERVLSHTGEFMGKAATDRQFDVESIHIYRLENGKVAEHWAKRDDVTLAQQIGLFEH